MPNIGTKFAVPPVLPFHWIITIDKKIIIQFQNGKFELFYEWEYMADCLSKRKGIININDVIQIDW